MSPEESLSQSIDCRDVEGASAALRAGANPNGRYHEEVHGWTYLQQAAAMNNPDLVRLLLQHKATVAATLDKEGSTALHHAAEDGVLPIVQLLIEIGDGRDWLNRFDYLERTPLACAAYENHADVVDYLIAVGSDVNANNEERIGETALSRAVQERASIRIIEALIRAGADPQIGGWMGISALDRARTQALEHDASELDKQILSLLEGATI